jgi:hypothetical protein
MLRILLYCTKIKLWENLTGGANSCFFAKDLENKNPQIYATVMKELRCYIDHVQDMYSALTHVRGGAIMSAPNALVQCEGHSGRLHSGYSQCSRATVK